MVNDDQKWWGLVRATFERFKYQNILTEDMVRFFSAELKRDMTPIFDQYLRRVNLPTLELTFDEKAETVSYRWNADERRFAMPIKVGTKRNWQVITPTSAWQTMSNKLGKALEVACRLIRTPIAGPETTTRIVRLVGELGLRTGVPLTSEATNTAYRPPAGLLSSMLT